MATRDFCPQPGSPADRAEAGAVNPRYARQLALPGLGPAGQRRLGRARVLVIGLGGLGSPVASSLAAAGVGNLRLVDADTVERSNLHRQFLHGEGAVGRPKTASAADRLRDLNPDIALELTAARFSPANAFELIAGCDLVLDGADNFATRYLANDACTLARVPLLQGSVLQWEGSIRLIDPARGGPCLRCHLPEPPAAGAVPSCAEGGVLGVLPNLVGSALALEALKHLLGQGESLRGRLLHLDALAHRWREWRLQPDPACPLCGSSPTISTLDPAAYPELCETSSPCIAPPVPAAMPQPDLPAPDATEVSVADLHALLDDETRAATVQVLDVREPWEVEFASLPGLIEIPLSQVPAALDRLRRDQPVWVLCKSGIRSDRVARYLREQGYQAANIEGGLDQWRSRIDPALPEY